METDVLDTVFAAGLGVVIGLLIGFVYFLIWKARHTGAIRQDAVARSQAVTVGKVTEQLLPYLPGFRFNPKDARFLGSPVDLVVFDGLDEGELRGVWFLEVKTRRRRVERPGAADSRRDPRKARGVGRAAPAGPLAAQNVSSMPTRTSRGGP